MGFNRAGSSAGPSQRLHAVFNLIGRKVVNRDNQEFVVYGDGSYCRMSNEAKQVVVSASAAVLLQFLADYLFDEPAANWLIESRRIDPLRYLPVAAVSKHFDFFGNPSVH